MVVVCRAGLGRGVGGGAGGGGGGVTAWRVHVEGKRVGISAEGVCVVLV